MLIRTRVWLWVLAVALAGCSNGPPAAPDAADEMPAEGGEEEVTVAAPQDTPPEGVVLHLGPEGTLHRNATPDGSVPFAGGYAAIFGPDEFPVLEFLSEPTNVTLVVEPSDVRAYVTLDADAPQATQGMFDVAAWFGSTLSMPLFAFTTMPTPVLVPGSPVTVEMSLPFGDYAPIVVPPGERLRLLVASGMVNEGQTGLSVVVGGDDGSRLEVVLSTRAADPLEGLVLEAGEPLTGTLANAGFLMCPGIADQSVRSHEYTVPQNITVLHAELDATSTTTGSDSTDLDLNLFADGLRIAGGHTPFPREGVFLTGPELAPLLGQTVELRVGGCFTGQADYRVDVRTG